MEGHLFRSPRGRASNRLPVARISQRRFRVQTLQRRRAMVQLILAADSAPPSGVHRGRTLGERTESRCEPDSDGDSTVRMMVMDHSGDSDATKTMDERFRVMNQLGNDHQRHNI